MMCRHNAGREKKFASPSGQSWRELSEPEVGGLGPSLLRDSSGESVNTGGGWAPGRGSEEAEIAMPLDVDGRLGDGQVAAKRSGEPSPVWHGSTSPTPAPRSAEKEVVVTVMWLPRSSGAADDSSTSMNNCSWGLERLCARGQLEWPSFQDSVLSRSKQHLRVSTDSYTACGLRRASGPASHSNG